MNSNDICQAEKILLRLASLLFDENVQSDWGTKLSNLANKKTLAVEDFRLQIKNLYGGMGSLSDIVLMKADGKVDREANNEFDDLRSELYQLVKRS